MLHTNRYVAWLLMSFLCLLSNKTIAKHSNGASGYIERYKEIAIQERIRTGIPASITLAQGLYESGIGGSELALLANNHFGIKCKSTWRGESHYVEDDDYDNNGKLRKSCFRKYDSVEESYRDHSDFLTTNSRYEKLFELSETDYIAWAKGLKACGYATNPEYADKLIELIERYDLDLYDKIDIPIDNPFIVINDSENSPTREELVSSSEIEMFNPNVQIEANGPGVPEAYSISNYKRNSFGKISRAHKKVDVNNYPVQEMRSRDVQRTIKKTNTTLAYTSKDDSPVSKRKEILNAPSYDIEYYELTEKGLSKPIRQKQHTINTSQKTSRFYPQRRQYQRRGK